MSKKFIVLLCLTVILRIAEKSMQAELTKNQGPKGTLISMVLKGLTK